MAPIRLLILSDLHVYSELPTGETPPSHVRVNETGLSLHSADKNPVSDLLACLDSDNIKADYVICCGDLGHRADPAGVQYSWRLLGEIAQKVDAKQLIATIGNHDVDSRFRTGDPNPFDVLKSLSPAFPFSDERLFDKFWSRNFSIFVEGDVRFVVLNTCSCHGYAKEYERGLISDWTLKQLQARLTAQGKYAVNILVCHHHPHRHTEAGLGSLDDLVGGDALMQELAKPETGNWLIVHGHKHHPKLCYAKGDGFSPIVFSAGSFSAQLYPELASLACNQFYCLTIDPASIESMGRMCGTFETWSWAFTEGWINKGIRNLGLPPSGGFGYRDGAGLIPLVVKAVRSGAWKKENLLGVIPGLKYVIPSELPKIFEECKGRGVVFSKERPFPEEFGMRKKP